MKKIIHFRFNLGEISWELLDSFAKSIQDQLPDYTVLVTPFYIAFEDEHDVALSLNGISYDHKQLEEMLDKAQMYDGLCN